MDCLLNTQCPVKVSLRRVLDKYINENWNELWTNIQYHVAAQSYYSEGKFYIAEICIYPFDQNPISPPLYGKDEAYHHAVYHDRIEPIENFERQFAYHAIPFYRTSTLNPHYAVYEQDIKDYIALLQKKDKDAIFTFKGGTCVRDLLTECGVRSFDLEHLGMEKYLLPGQKMRTCRFHRKNNVFCAYYQCVEYVTRFRNFIIEKK